MTLEVTLVSLLAALGVTVFANIMARKPSEPGRVRLTPYLGIQFLGLIATLALAAHLITLVTGKPFTGGFVS